ncbi:MAG: prepilin-type N-terminal cleavage/methylation domain-containing protein [Kyrpidia sp.]|nr:prepilin-type N-terminal cleavage/methylation domain-containing protein [Kyrpidia sp.]
MEIENRRQGGMTLVELLAAILILVIITGGIFVLFDHAFRNWYRVSEQERLQSEANIVAERIGRDLATPEGGGTVSDVSGTAGRLQINVKVDQSGGGSTQIVYLFQQDPATGRTQLWRTVGNRPPGLLGQGDVDYTGSHFDTSATSLGQVGLHLHLTGPRGMTFDLDSSLKFRFAQ